MSQSILAAVPSECLGRILAHLPHEDINALRCSSRNLRSSVILGMSNVFDAVKDHLERIAVGEFIQGVVNEIDGLQNVRRTIVRSPPADVLYRGRTPEERVNNRALVFQHLEAIIHSHGFFSADFSPGELDAIRADGMRSGMLVKLCLPQSAGDVEWKPVALRFEEQPTLMHKSCVYENDILALDITIILQYNCETKTYDVYRRSMEFRFFDRQRSSPNDLAQFAKDMAFLGDAFERWTQRPCQVCIESTSEELRNVCDVVNELIACARMK